MIYKLSDLPGTILPISNQLEDNANVIKFDISEWAEIYPDGDISIDFMRPGDSAIYPVAVDKLNLDDNILSWTVDENVTAISGYGAIVLICKQGDITARTPRIATMILVGLPSSGPPPDPVQDWIRAVNGLLNDIDNALDNIGSIHFEINEDGELEVNYG